jgi:DNA-binding NarL/FixJ family response regulator
VVDDHPTIRDLVRLMCSEIESVQVVGEAADGREALHRCRALSPDVMLLDLRMPHMDGFEVARRLREEGNPVRILAFTGSFDSEALFECRRVGVNGFLLKEDGMPQLLGAIRDVANGQMTFSSQQEQTVHRRLAEIVRHSREARTVGASLSARQLEVLRLISKGLTTRQVASKLNISERTAEAHLAKVFRKLGARTRLQAVTRAVRLKLLDVDPAALSG